MRKITFVISIPMLPPDTLKLLKYADPVNGDIICESRFPGIAMIKNNIHAKADVNIVTVRTIDDNSRSEECYRLFKEELSALSDDISIKLDINTEISVPHNEDISKEKQLLKSLFNSFPENSDVFMDVTYGTKMTAIEMFSSLCYAEIAKKCSIKSIIYGKYSFNGSDTGQLYDVINLYNLMRLIETSSHMDKNSFKDLVLQIID